MGLSTTPVQFVCGPCRSQVLDVTRHIVIPFNRYIEHAHACACTFAYAFTRDSIILDRKLRARVDAEPDLFWLDIFDQLLNPNKFVGCLFDWWVDRFVIQLGVLSRNRPLLFCTVPTPIPVTVIIQEHYCGRSLTSMARTWARAI